MYNDPIANKLLEAKAYPGKEVSSVTIGKDVGKSKWNPKTKQYFPILYIYDPFTGDKLEWTPHS